MLIPENVLAASADTTTKSLQSSFTSSGWTISAKRGLQGIKTVR